MIVVSDTSPITALLTVGEEVLLQKLFGEVVIPAAVYAELLRHHKGLPGWINIQAVRDQARVTAFRSELDHGEAEAIQLALELRAESILMDERKGRAVAESNGIPVIGLLGAIVLARQRGHISSARLLLEKIETEAGFYVSKSLKTSVLRSLGELD